ncbi:hypothetical protein AVEN_221583-1 [Araneus ventricosus]|uniref:Uncharacterized protein n=1 Tax=Araneus ventricosus TaxID=182803 RepID=A0A4Y2U802_ARAVE|nr:hypothetical protein AVEN_221583-1 [Araneus ventricosus]
MATFHYFFTEGNIEVGFFSLLKSSFVKNFDEPEVFMLCIEKSDPSVEDHHLLTKSVNVCGRKRITTDASEQTLRNLKLQYKRLWNQIEIPWITQMLILNTLLYLFRRLIIKNFEKSVRREMKGKENLQLRTVRPKIQYWVLPQLYLQS